MTSTFTYAKAKGALPFLGHAISLVSNPRDFLRSLPAQGDLVKIGIGPSKAFVICDPDLTHQVLVNDRIFDKGGPFVDRLREFIGDSVSTCPRSEHRRQRRLMQPAFHHSRFPAYAAMMVEETTTVIDQWRDGEVIDVYAMMQAITTKITARTMFASSASAALIADAYDALNDIIMGAGRRMLTPPPLDRVPTPGKRRYDRARVRIREITDQLVAEYRAAGVDHQDLMSMLLAARDENGDVLSDQEISDQVVTLFLGGVETVASTLGWALCLLAQHPDVEQRLDEEVDAVVGEGQPGWEHLSELSFTTGIINESLRMYPPGWLLTRIVTADTELGGHTIPRGATIIYSPYLLHYRKDLFPEPERFAPDRWTGSTKPPRFAFVPFADGPRRCIGDTFTMIEAPLVLATIARRWRMHPVGATMRPTRHMSLLLTPRKMKIRLAVR